jgi:hypothetical protein
LDINKLSNRILICWGGTILATPNGIKVTFPISFNNNAKVICGRVGENVNDYIVMAKNVTTSYFYAYSTVAGGAGSHYIAIGY